MILICFILYVVMLWVASKTYNKKTQKDIFPSRWPLLALFVMNFVPTLAIIVYILLTMWWWINKWDDNFMFTK